MAKAKNKSTPAYDRVRAARGGKRPTGLDYVKGVFSDFFELHGDRAFSDDAAVAGGIAWLYDKPVTVIALEKGHSTKERSKRNFGSPHPEGYRKALRLMKQAEKFHRPVVCFVDTAGAYPGVGAEERGQGAAIAENLLALSGLRTPVLSIFIGEGGSGGALALSVADEVWMLENAVYSVISPEGCASILWKDASKAPEAAAFLRLQAQDALEMGVCDRILPEKGLGSRAFYRDLSRLIYDKLTELSALDAEALVGARYARFRQFGTGA
ncbi:MAG: acetyl-CoA carboxylase carboxyltransferase subunit alpha [Clostridiales Family XIII bacterium]|jgi:acetyl-CoA carboxylase carboxyl transferase subunit alpha|nr:acetyl-CoA carboxylase carboxyltransferase subunit alpha [Clostridiales Family XIII bacterium]